MKPFIDWPRKDTEGAKAARPSHHSLLCFLRLFVATSFVAVLPVHAVEVAGLPKAGEPHHAKIIAAQEKTLGNGLRVIVIERPGLPLLSAQLLIKTGAESDPAKLAGLAHFTATLLKRGTTTRSAQKIAEETEALGAKIETEGTWDATGVKLTALSSNAEPALAIVADLVRNPALAKEEIDRQRRETLDDLLLALEEPGNVAKYSASRATLGLAPYGHPENGTPADLARITRKDVVALHDRAYHPGNSILVIAGNITAGNAFAMAEKIFGDWNGAAKPAEKPVPAPVPHARAILVDMPNAGQAAVYVAAPSIAREAADWYAGKVANALLGGGYSSRLNQEVRVKRGLSYGAGSGLSTWRNGGLFIAGAQTKNESAAEVVKVVQAEIERLSKEPAPVDYLKTRQNVLTGAFSRDLETNEGYVKRVGELALYGLPLDSLESYVDHVDQITPADLQAFAEKHFTADVCNVVVAGQGKVVEKPLRALFPKLEVVPLSKLDLDAPTLRATGKK
ncbi:peptidase M16 domain protein [Chthoniobacter flavus Ellin428]|uniref:Peptidase M16 domain protein n=1 Tax=Chthoniobacter flavus Ellin428 TaxID=497964 RepID=B4D4B0_9BACT|nr:peptidase M16 domain protein [Chthoniobacter flavus Ellin428]TCO89050.1 putative Zn-dependent peptidase [Chthoniobacter flavus]